MQLTAAIALGGDVPVKARDAAVSAHEHLTAGINLLTHRISGPLPTARVIDVFGQAIDEMTSALATVNALPNRVQLPDPDAAIQ